MIAGIDYSWDRPSPNCLAGAGYAFVVRYIGGTGGKYLDRDELAALRAEGLAVAFVYQTTRSFMLGGAEEGIAAAQRCADHLEALGIDEPVPVYHSLDRDPRQLTGRQWAAVRTYLDGVAALMGRGRVGIYGGYEAVRRAQNEGWAPWAWQTYGWSAGQWHDGAQLRQVRNGVRLCGGLVDLCEATTPHYGQHPSGEDMDTRMLLTDGSRYALTDWTSTTIYKVGRASTKTMLYLWGGERGPAVRVKKAVIDDLAGEGPSG